MKHLFYISILLFSFACLLSACQKDPRNTGINNFDDAGLRSIAEAQDRRETESLLKYLDDRNSIYRAAAAEAFGSVQDTSALQNLFSLMDDKNAEVRKAAAYAIGQTKAAQSFSQLSPYYQKETAEELKSVILEALGKLASQQELNFFQNITTADEESQAALAMALYRAASKGLDLNDFKTKVFELLQSKSEGARLYAAHLLSRARQLELSEESNLLISAIQKEAKEEIKSMLTLALKNAPQKESVDFLIEQSMHDPGPMVRISAARALAAFPINDYFDRAIHLMSTEQNAHVRATIANTLSLSVTDSLATVLLNLADIEEDWLTRMTLYAGVLKANPNNTIVITYLFDLFDSVPGPYAKAQVLEVLGHSHKSWSYLASVVEKNLLPVIHTTAINSMGKSRAHPLFDDQNSETFANELKSILLNSEDGTTIGLVADMVRKPELGFKAQFPDAEFFEGLREKISMPRESESLISLEKTIAFLNDTTYKAVKIDFNNPIDWDYVSAIPRNRQVKLITDKGDIVLQLMVDKAPGTVANFTGLVETNYLIGKNFHRVVPNFVIQGGCPRGDGMGGEDYSIRSELPKLHYKSGSVGMASAGKDTEGVQFFITHHPTPHLDGTYTIFAEVVKGMENVQLITVGDKITGVEILTTL